MSGAIYAGRPRAVCLLVDRSARGFNQPGLARTGEGDLHAVLAEEDIAPVDLPDFAHDPLAHAGVVELFGHVRDDQVADVGLGGQLGQLTVPHRERGEGLAGAVPET